MALIHFYRQAFMLAWAAVMPFHAIADTEKTESACQFLAAQISAQTSQPLFLPSFPSVTEGPLHQSAFLYDNAVAAIALVGCNEKNKAKLITDAVVLAQKNDRFWHDGRLRNAYLAGAVNSAPVKLPGWWDAEKKQWLEDRYQVGSDVGNMAWALLSLLAIDPELKQQDYRAAALSLAQWIEGFHDQRGIGAYTGGVFAHEPAPERLLWKSAEHNTDLIAVFRLLHAATGDKKWHVRMDENIRFVSSLWNAQRKTFATGVIDDGVTVNPIVAMDAQVWPLLAIPGFVQRYPSAEEGAANYMGYEGGFAYSEAKEGVWTEGSAQMLLLYRLLGRVEKAEALASVLAQLRAENGAYFASSHFSIPTSFMLQTDPNKPRLYFKLPHLGATAWMALAQQRFNPFTFNSSLP